MQLGQTRLGRALVPAEDGLAGVRSVSEVAAQLSGGRLGAPRSTRGPYRQALRATDEARPPPSAADPRRGRRAHSSSVRGRARWSRRRRPPAALAGCAWLGAEDDHGAPVARSGAARRARRRSALDAHLVGPAHQSRPQDQEADSAAVLVDYGTLERRRAFCHEEVRLSRRLAPGCLAWRARVLPAAGRRVPDRRRGRNPVRLSTPSRCAATTTTPRDCGGSPRSRRASSTCARSAGGSQSSTSGLRFRTIRADRCGPRRDARVTTSRCSASSPPASATPASVGSRLSTRSTRRYLIAPTESLIDRRIVLLSPRERESSPAARSLIDTIKTPGGLTRAPNRPSCAPTPAGLTSALGRRRSNQARVTEIRAIST